MTSSLPVPQPTAATQSSTTKQASKLSIGGSDQEGQNLEQATLFGLTGVDRGSISTNPLEMPDVLQ
eukprot:COSAG02_NODE_42596_length_383_cov_0.725352_1_plen_65_part_10